MKTRKRKCSDFQRDMICSRGKARASQLLHQSLSSDVLVKTQTAYRTRSHAKQETLELFLQVLPLVVQHGYLNDTADLMHLEGTSKSVREIMIREDDRIWGSHHFHQYFDCKQKCQKVPIPLSELRKESFRSFYYFQRAHLKNSLEWLKREFDRVIALDDWKKLMHYGVECGICGCNCNQCVGIPITSQFRFERVDLGIFANAGEQIQRRTRRFCQNCFENTDVGLHRDFIEKYYKRVEHKPLWKTVVDEIVYGTGKSIMWCEWLPLSKEKSFNVEEEDRKVAGVVSTTLPFFRTTTTNNTWWEDYSVNMDDLAVIVGYALTCSDSRYERLDLSSMHHCCPTCTMRSGFGPRGMKALAYGLNHNKNLKSIIFSDNCKTCEQIIDGGNDDYWNRKDGSKGMLSTAIKVNPHTKIEKIVVCPRSIGPEAQEELQNLRNGSLQIEISS